MRLVTLFLLLCLFLVGCAGKDPFSLEASTPQPVSVSGCSGGQLDDGTLVWECPTE